MYGNLKNNLNLYFQNFDICMFSLSYRDFPIKLYSNGVVESFLAGLTFNYHTFMPQFFALRMYEKTDGIKNLSEYVCNYTKLENLKGTVSTVSFINVLGKIFEKQDRYDNTINLTDTEMLMSATEAAGNVMGYFRLLNRTYMSERGTNLLNTIFTHNINNDFNVEEIVKMFEYYHIVKNVLGINTDIIMKHYLKGYGSRNRKLTASYYNGLYQHYLETRFWNDDKRSEYCKLLDKYEKLLRNDDFMVEQQWRNITQFLSKHGVNITFESYLSSKGYYTKSETTV
jgi:hypothetical protein